MMLWSRFRDERDFMPFEKEMPLASETVPSVCSEMRVQIDAEQTSARALADLMVVNAQALNFGTPDYRSLPVDPLDGADLETVVLVAHVLAGRLARATGGAGA